MTSMIPNVRYSNQRIFRGAAKTTISRVFSSKRIAYGVSKTILYVGASKGSGSLGAWLRNNVERNKLWSGAFNLTPGRKWTDTEFEIWHEPSKRTSGASSSASPGTFAVSTSTTTGLT
jgi:hypothetical protein